MAKIIKLTDKERNDIIEKFKKFIEEVKMADGKVNFTESFNVPQRKANLCFSEKAWYKMHELVNHFDKEVAWHGTARRGEDAEKDEYIIDDIFVYPQEVSGATVNTDQIEYQQWLYGLDDDTFNNLRMQGHSHVNMSTSPSGVDITHQEKILSQLTDDMFYIFLIWNKKDEKTIKIYDFAKNILFETNDIDVLVIEEDIGIITFIENADKVVKSKTYTYTPSYQNNKNDTKTDTKEKENKKEDKQEKKDNKKDNVVDIIPSESKRKGRRRDDRDDAPSYYNDYYGNGYYPPAW